jgi:hypothetical protein
MSTHTVGFCAQCGGIYHSIAERDALNSSQSTLTSGTDRNLSSNSCNECVRAMSSLLMYGVPAERARTVANGIGVLATRCQKSEWSLTDEIRRLREFIEYRCVGAGPGADAERWRLIDQWRKAGNKPPENETGASGHEAKPPQHCHACSKQLPWTADNPQFCPYCGVNSPVQAPWWECNYTGPGGRCAHSNHPDRITCWYCRHPRNTLKAGDQR